MEENGRFRVIAFNYDDAPQPGGAQYGARIHFPFPARPANARSWLTFCTALPLPDHPRRDRHRGGDTARRRKAISTITNWNAITVATLSADTTKQPVEDILYAAFVQAAVYNAVVGIQGRYAPYRFHAHAPRGASARRAAVAAATEILVTYLPSAQATLDADYAASLASPTARRKYRGITLRHPRRRQPDPAARPRRPQRPHLLHPAAGAGGLAAHPASVPADVGAVARLRDAASGARRAQFAPPGPPALASRASSATSTRSRPWVRSPRHSERRRRRAPRRSSPATPWCSTTPR